MGPYLDYKGSGVWSFVLHGVTIVVLQFGNWGLHLGSVYDLCLFWVERLRKIVGCAPQAPSMRIILTFGPKLGD